MASPIDVAAFSTWLDRYKLAWEARDPALAAALFTDDATYAETPFDAPLRGRDAVADYWARVTAGQKDVTFSYEVLACTGDTGLCRWHAAFTGDPGGEAIDLDGIFRCRFADPDRVRTLEEWWHIRVVPPGGA